MTGSRIRNPTVARNVTISITGKSAVSAFTMAEPTVNVADALSTNRIACRRAARTSAPGRLKADVSIPATLLQAEPRLHNFRLFRHAPHAKSEVPHECQHRRVVRQDLTDHSG